MSLRQWYSKLARAADDFSDSLPLGAAPLIILTLALVSGGWLLLHPIEENAATLRMWTFANTHALAYQKALPEFERQHPGVTADVQLVHGVAVTSRLRAAFWSDLDVPDLAEVEISVAGSFFRGPLDQVGFEDLTDRLKAPGPGGEPPLYDRMVKTRFAPYSCKGRIFGLPHDVHPVMLAYRKDLFDQLGIDPSKLTTWEDFIREGRRVTRFGANVKPEDTRYMIQLADATSGYFEVVLFQRDGGYFDADGRLTMESETVVETLKWYVPLVAGPNRIGNDPGFSGAAFAKAVEDGYILSFMCPDWRSRFCENDVPQVAAKMALAPLPAFAPGGRRTSTWGGTMLGITRRCPNKDIAWQLACYLYTDPEQLAGRFRETNILPPFKAAWDQPAFKEPRPYWCNQPIGSLYAALADDVPPQYTSPFVELVKAKMSGVLAACATYYNNHGEDGFDAFARSRLKQAADDVRRQMTRNPF